MAWNRYQTHVAHHWPLQLLRCNVRKAALFMVVYATHSTATYPNNIDLDDRARPKRFQRRTFATNDRGTTMLLMLHRGASTSYTMPEGAMLTRLKI